MPYQNVIVTGANRGLGFEFVRQFLNTNPPPSNLIATTRNPSPQLEELKSQHSNLHILIYDATNYDSYPAFVEQVKQIVGDGGGVDLLVNNAGMSIHTSLGSIKPQDMLTNFEVNVVAPLTLTQSLLPLLRQSASTGHKTVIANISSGLGSISGYSAIHRPGLPLPYATSKAALNMVSKALALDLQADGIIVIPFRPGWVKTDMGGPNAALTPETSISGMMKVLEDVDLSQTGTFLSWEGSVQTW